mmetsp:Transcript_17942/g.47070  ORF Transcript_17942/g.47070 Transcript_17942/m.47070 type:complete len:244 (-) Transcript_17942:905-1636(-)
MESVSSSASSDSFTADISRRPSSSTPAMSAERTGCLAKMCRRMVGSIESACCGSSLRTRASSFRPLPRSTTAPSSAESRAFVSASKPSARCRAPRCVPSVACTDARCSWVSPECCSSRRCSSMQSSAFRAFSTALRARHENDENGFSSAAAPSPAPASATAVMPPPLSRVFCLCTLDLSVWPSTLCSDSHFRVFLSNALSSSSFCFIAVSFVSFHTGKGTRPLPPTPGPPAPTPAPAPPWRWP